jgi:hypothetical protein
LSGDSLGRNQDERQADRGATSGRQPETQTAMTPASHRHDLVKLAAD